METETPSTTVTTTRPPVAPDFQATELDHREHQLAMREWWLNQADQAMDAARQAADNGDSLTAMLRLSDARTSLAMSRVYRNEVGS
jgi:hypothetical protein